MKKKFSIERAIPCAILALEIVIVYILMQRILVSPSKTAKAGNNAILLYGRMSCPYTAKAINQLKKDGAWSQVEFVDTGTRSGQVKFDKLNVSGVPHFVNTRTGNSVTGYNPDTQKLMDELN